MLPSVVSVVSAARKVTPARRTACLQEFLGAPCDAPEVLQRRAEIVTALREAGLWPVDMVKR